MEFLDSDLYLCTTCFSLTSLGENTQRCKCEPEHEERIHDCPSGYHLCYLCSIEVAGGLSRWSWEACDPCRKVNERRKARGQNYYLLGRHSIMNNISIPLQEISKKELAEGTQAMLGFIGHMEELRTTARARVEEMFRSVPRWADLSHIPIEVWEAEFIDGRGGSLNVSHGE